MGEFQPGSRQAPAATGDPGGIAGPALAAPGGRGAAWHARARTTRLLAWVSLGWMAGEGALGLVAGARSGSISLTGWAAGSVIEGLASVIVIWRFTGSRTLSATAEDRARKAVAVSFFLLAPYLAIESVQDLLTGYRPATSVLGIALTAASVLVMPVLGVAKQRLGARLDSRATAGRARRTCCAPRRPPRCSLAWPLRPCWAGGGPTRSSPLAWLLSRSARGVRPGAATTAANCPPRLAGLGCGRGGRRAGGRRRSRCR
jgi:hypothetical protein